MKEYYSWEIFRKSVLLCEELFIFPGKIRGLLPYQPVYSKEMVERIDKIDKIVRSNRPSFSFQPLDCYCNYKVSGTINRNWSAFIFRVESHLQ